MIGSRAQATRADDSTREVTIGRHLLRVDVRAGDRTRPPLVMCNGLGIGFEALQPLVDALDPDMEVIRFDVPGVGGSPVGVLPYGFPQLALLLQRLLDKLGYHGEVDIVGFSWGGALAQQFAVQHWRRCRRLVLVGTNTGVWSIPAKVSMVAKLATSRQFEDYVAAMTGPLNGNASGRRNDDTRRVLSASRAAFSGRGVAYQLAAVACWTSLPFLRLIRQPVLVMAGDRDAIVPVSNARILAAGIPNATLFLYPGGHMEPLIRAPEFGRRISGFLAG